MSFRGYDIDKISSVERILGKIRSDPNRSDGQVESPEFYCGFDRSCDRENRITNRKSYD